MTLKAKKNSGFSTLTRVAIGFESLNDISKQLNLTVSAQTVVYMIAVLLMAIYTCLGLYKYFEVAYSYVKWYLFFGVTAHVLVIGQAVVNDSSSRCVSFVSWSWRFQPNQVYHRLKNYLRKWEKSPVAMSSPKNNWNISSVQNSWSQVAGFSKWICPC